MLYPMPINSFLLIAEFIQGRTFNYLQNQLSGAFERAIEAYEKVLTFKERPLKTHRMG